MEKVYRKLPNGRYEHIGYNNTPDISNGVWLVQNGKGYKSHSSLLWRVGDTGRVTDVITHAKLQTMNDELCTYLMNLTKSEDTPERQDAKEILGGYLRGDIGFYGISPSDLTSLFVRQIGLILEKTEGKHINKINDSPEYSKLWDLIKQARDEADNQGLDRLSENLDLLLEVINGRCVKRYK